MLRRAGHLMPLVLLLLVTSVEAREPLPTSAGKLDEKTGVVWYDIKQLGVEGRGWNETLAYYDRLPAKAKGVVRDPVWNLSQHSAGMSVRFVTESQQISARWKLRSASLAMPHMPATGVSGVDLYARLPSGKWHWLAVGRPTAQENTQALTSELVPGEREYLLYLPLYNGVESVEIGIPKTQALLKAAPRKDPRPIVFYGTSITHGACASRPGMTYSAILGRWYDRSIINLGFSGNAKSEPEVASLLAELDPSVFVINPLPNMTATEVTERIGNLITTIRKARPNTPIVVCEDRTYANAVLVPKQRERNDTSRAALKIEYDKLLKAGIKGLYYVDGESQLALDGEDTVDASHPNDLGFMHQAEAMHKILGPLMK
ncbi:MAG: SGNH/GDSL hydrolase family protein [Planctomycetaceae bacterium]|nr:SGNH/GDSL hydrolase family protein [Planctomycetaceae bacterium]